MKERKIPTISIGDYTFRVVKRTTQRGQDMLRQYQHARRTTELTDCYKNCSVYKERAYAYCHDLYKKLNGENYRIPGYNSWMFTFAFLLPDTGAIIYITKDHDYIIL